MSEIRRKGMEFVGYDYKEISASGERASFCLDCYQNFGWLPDERTQETRGAIVLRRERKIVNKVELTRLQCHFEACMDEITALEKSKTTNAAAAPCALGWWEPLSWRALPSRRCTFRRSGSRQLFWQSLDFWAGYRPCSSTRKSCPAGPGLWPS